MHFRFPSSGTDEISALEHWN